MLSLAALACASCTTVGVPAGPPGLHQVPQLSSLDPRCGLRTQYVGLPGLMRDALIMRCGNAEVVIRGPNNMIGHVQIRTREQALEYLRFFSSPDTYGLFDLGGMVEVVSSTVPEVFNAVEPSIFARYFRTPTVSEHDSKCRWDGDLDCGKCFAIERPGSVSR